MWGSKRAFGGDNDEYLDNEMLEPCVSEEEVVSEDEGQEHKNQLPCVMQTEAF